MKAAFATYPPSPGWLDLTYELPTIAPSASLTATKTLAGAGNNQYSRALRSSASGGNASVSPARTISRKIGQIPVRQSVSGSASRMITFMPVCNQYAKTGLPVVSDSSSQRGNQRFPTEARRGCRKLAGGANHRLRHSWSISPGGASDMGAASAPWNSKSGNEALAQPMPGYVVAMDSGGSRPPQAG